MSMFSALEISGSAMEAQRQRAEVTAANMANAETTRTPNGGPYHRKQVVFQSSGNTPFQMMLAGFRRGDVREDHEFFDQLLCLDAVRRDNAVEGAVGLQDQFAFWNVERERLARVARLGERPISGKERF